MSSQYLNTSDGLPVYSLWKYDTENYIENPE